MIAIISFVGLSHYRCLKVKVLDSSIISAFIKKHDFILNNDNLLATDRLGVLVDSMNWAVLI